MLLRKFIVGTEHLGQVFLIKKWHQYVKHLNFETVSHQLVSLREQLVRSNPNEEGESFWEERFVFAVKY